MVNEWNKPSRQTDADAIGKFKWRVDARVGGSAQGLRVIQEGKGRSCFTNRQEFRKKIISISRKGNELVSRRRIKVTREEKNEEGKEKKVRIGE